MSEITKSGINECINQEKGKNKREATSPLLENVETQCTGLSSSIGLTPLHTLDSATGITGSKTDTTRSKRTKTHSDCSDCSDDSISQTTPVNAPYNTRQIIDWNSIMAYSQIPPYNPMHSPFLPSPPPPGYAGVPPPWAADLIKDIKVIKDKMKSIEKIEKTVNLINARVADIETKVKAIDTRVTDTEQFCEFLAKENESVKVEVKEARKEFKQFKTSCSKIEEQSRQFLKQKRDLEDQISNLEMQSLQNNLLFYGIPEGGNLENTDRLVKDFCKESLKLENADRFTIEKTQRVGKRNAGRARPILATFHYRHERERVRSSSFDVAEDLKAAGRGVGVQLPRSVREARRPLYPTMEQAIKDGKRVKFVGKRLYVEGVEVKVDSE